MYAIEITQYGVVVPFIYVSSSTPPSLNIFSMLRWRTNKNNEIYEQIMCAYSSDDTALDSYLDKVKMKRQNTLIINAEVKRIKTNLQNSKESMKRKMMMKTTNR